MVKLTRVSDAIQIRSGRIFCLSIDLLTNASNEPSIEGRRDHVGGVFGAGAALEHFHVEGILVASLHGQQFPLLNTGRMLHGVVHHWKRTRVNDGSSALVIITLDGFLNRLRKVRPVSGQGSEQKRDLQGPEPEHFPNFTLRNPGIGHFALCQDTHFCKTAQGCM